MSETKICPNCGKEILAVAKKCKYCGTWVEPKKEGMSVPANKPKNKWIIPVIAAALLLGLVAFFFFMRPDPIKSVLEGSSVTNSSDNYQNQSVSESHFWKGSLIDGDKRYAIDMKLEVSDDGSDVSGYYHYASQPDDKRIFLSGWAGSGLGAFANLSQVQLKSDEGYECFDLAWEHQEETMEGIWRLYTSASDCEEGNENYKKEMKVKLTKR